jgi:hypothetical protein
VARYRYTISPAGSAKIELKIRTEDTGEAADSRRGLFAGSNDPRRYAAWLQSQFPGAELLGEPKIDMRPGRKAATMELEATVARSALLSRGGIAAFPGEFDWASKLVPAGRRYGPLLLPVRPDLEWSIEVQLGRPPAELPSGSQIDGPFGSLSLVIEPQGSGYRVDGRFHLEPGLITADQAPALRDFLVDVQRQLARTLETP